MSRSPGAAIRALPAAASHSRAAANARTITAEIDWLARVLDARYRLHFGDALPTAPLEAIVPPDVDGHISDYAELVRRQRMAFAERLLLILALVPHIRPASSVVPTTPSPEGPVTVRLQVGGEDHDAREVLDTLQKIGSISSSARPAGGRRHQYTGRPCPGLP